MDRRRALWASAATVLVIAVGSSWLWRARAAAPAGTASPVVALVQVQPLLTRMLPDTVSALAEVVAASPRTLNFVQAGRLTLLPVVAGQLVREGGLLATLEPDPNGQLAFVQARNAVQLTQAELQRLTELNALQLATTSQVDAAAKAHQDALAALAAQKSLGAGDASPSLRAPFDGVVLAVPAAQGDRIAAGAPVVQLASSRASRVRIGIEPTDARRVAPGTRVSLVALDRPEASFVVSVSEIQGALDPKTQLVNAIADLPSAWSARLVPGTRLRATLMLDQRQARVVPRNAVLSDEQGDYLFQIDGGTAHRTPVRKGIESGGLVEVDGADPARPVVTVGNYELEDGMRVRIQPS